VEHVVEGVQEMLLAVVYRSLGVGVVPHFGFIQLLAYAPERISCVQSPRQDMRCKLVALVPEGPEFGYFIGC
jgi:hypothetical protein